MLFRSLSWYARDAARIAVTGKAEGLGDGGCNGEAGWVVDYRPSGVWLRTHGGPPTHVTKWTVVRDRAVEWLAPAMGDLKPAHQNYTAAWVDYCSAYSDSLDAGPASTNRSELDERQRLLHSRAMGFEREVVAIVRGTLAHPIVPEDPILDLLELLAVMA